MLWFLQLLLLRQVKEALATGALDVNEKDAKGDSLLHLAARNGHKAIVKEVFGHVAEREWAEKSEVCCWRREARVSESNAVSCTSLNACKLICTSAFLMHRSRHS